MKRTSRQVPILLLAFLFVSLSVAQNDVWNPRCVYQNGNKYLDLNSMTGLSDQFGGDYNTPSSDDAYNFVFQPCREIYSTALCEGSNLCQSGITVASSNRFTISENNDGTFAWTSFADKIGNCARKANVTITCDPTATTPSFTDANEPEICYYTFNLRWNCLSIDRPLMNTSRTNQAITIRGSNLDNKSVWLGSRSVRITSRTSTSLVLSLTSTVINAALTAGVYEYSLQVKDSAGANYGYINMILAPGGVMHLSNSDEGNSFRYVAFRYFARSYKGDPMTIYLLGEDYNCYHQMIVRTTVNDLKFVSESPGDTYFHCPIIIDGGGGQVSFEGIVWQNVETYPIFFVDDIGPRYAISNSTAILALDGAVVSFDNCKFYMKDYGSSLTIVSVSNLYPSVISVTDTYFESWSAIYSPTADLQSLTVKNCVFRDGTSAIKLPGPVSVRGDLSISGNSFAAVDHPILISNVYGSLGVSDNQATSFLNFMEFTGQTGSTMIQNNTLYSALKGFTFTSSLPPGNIYFSRNRFSQLTSPIEVSTDYFQDILYLSSSFDTFIGSTGSCIKTNGYTNANIESGTFRGNNLGSSTSVISFSSIYSSTGSVTVSNSLFDSNNCYRVVDVTYGLLTVTGSNFTNNQIANKGCISISTSSGLIVDSCRFTNNSALGGAAVTADSSSLSISNSVFERNNARIEGGAISVSTSVNSDNVEISISSSIFSENSCSGSGGAVTISGYVPKVTLRSNEFSTNVAAGGGGGISMTGAIFDILNFTECTFQGNSGGDSGGGFLLDGQVTKSLTISDSKFILNEAANGGGGASIAGKIPNLILSGSIFQSNTAGTIAAGLNLQRQITNTTMWDNQFIGNECEALGGGLVFQVNGNTATLSNCTFSENVASLVGGGVHITAACKLSNQFSISNSRFDSNLSPLGGAFNSRGNVPNIKMDGLTFFENVGADGSCIAMDGLKMSTVSLTNSYFEKNIGTRSPGILISTNITTFSISSSNFTDNSGVNGPILLSGQFKDQVKISRCSFKGNSAEIGGGITLLNSYANISFNIDSSSFYENVASSGSSLYMNTVENSSLVVQNCRFDENQGKDGNLWITVKNSSPTFSTTVSVSNSNFTKNSGDSGTVLKTYGTLQKVLISNLNAVQNEGDSISVSSSSLLQVSSSTFDSNVGSCLSTSNSTIFVNQTFFQNNKGKEGTSIRISSSNKVYLSKVRFLNNYASSNGPALSISGPFEEIFVENSEILGNYAENSGALSLSAGSYSSPNQLEVSSTNFNNNTAKKGGAVSLASSVNANFKDSKFLGNSGENGGAFSFASDAQFFGFNLTFESNNGTYGGAVFISSQNANDSVQFSGSKFTNNGAKEGGALYVQNNGMNFTVSNCDFTGNYISSVALNGTLHLKSSYLNVFQKRQESSSSFFSILGDSDLDLTDSSFDENGLITVAPGSKLKLSGASMSAVSCPPSSSFSQSPDGSLTCTADPEISSTSTSAVVSPKDSVVFPTGAIIGIAVGGAFVLIALVVLGLLLWNRQRKINQSETAAVKMSVLLGNLMITDVNVGQVIGKGFFGEVYVGSWNGLAVALKGITADEEDTDAARKWKEEIKLLHKLNHPNIVRLLGLYEHQERLFMVMEYAEHGSVDSFLKKYKDQLRAEDLLRMSYEVARGMQYLEKVGVIHRDLASRNLLLDALLHVKISDFGMSREDSVYTVKSKTLPFRWCAPEVLTSGSSTIKSDVWSFGVTVWEIFSFASYPFEHMTNEQVMENTMDPRGERLMRPPLCPPSVWEIVCVCWMNDPAERPSFKEICGLYSSNFPELKVQVVMEASSSNPNSGSNIEELERDHYNNINSGRGTLPDNHNYGAIKKQSDSGGGEPLPSNYGALPPRDQ